MESPAAFAGWRCSKKGDKIRTAGRENEEVMRMKKNRWSYFALTILVLFASGFSCKKAVQSGYSISPIPFTEVKLADEF